MSEEVNLNIGINVDDVTKSLDKVQKDTEKTKKGAEMAINSAMRGLRRAAQLSILMSEAIFGSIDATLRYVVEGAIQSAELLTTVATASALGGFTGVLALRAAVQFSSVVSIYVQVSQMIAGRAEAAQQSGRVAIFLRTLASYTY